MYWKAVPLWWKRIFKSYIWETSSGKVLYTFDDGPHPDSTEIILSHLQSKGIKALFFVLGENVVKYPELAIKIKDYGHDIGIHGFTHANLWMSSLNSFKEDFLLVEQICKRYNLNATHYRPPYGRITARQAKYVRQKGYQIMLWDIMPGDFDKNVTKEDCLMTLQKHLKPNSIIVMHDTPTCLEKVTFVIQNIPL